MGKRHQLRAHSSLWVLFIRAFHVHKAYRRSTSEAYSSSLTTLTARAEYISPGFHFILLSSSLASAHWILWKDYQSQINATGPLKVESRWSCCRHRNAIKAPLCCKMVDLKRKCWGSLTYSSFLMQHLFAKGHSFFSGIAAPSSWSPLFFFFFFLLDWFRLMVCRLVLHILSLSVDQ